MVLLCSAPYYPEQARAIMRQVAVEGRSPEDWESMRQRHRLGDEQIRALWRQTNSFKDSYEDMNFTPPQLATIKTPTLIAHGDRDPLYPVGLAVEMKTAIPNSWLWIIPNGGHPPIFGEFGGGGVKSEFFAETALEFLRGKWAAKG